MPGLPGVRGYIEYQLLNTLAFVLITLAPAVVLGDGPTEAARYRNGRAGYDAHIVRRWLEPQLVLSDEIRELAGMDSSFQADEGAKLDSPGFCG